MKFSMLIVFGLLSSAYAQELAFSRYLKMQEALSTDDFKAALQVHKDICDKEVRQLKGEYKDCGKAFGEIEDLRVSFKSLSEAYLKHGNQQELKALTKAFCPMAKAKWIQKNGSFQNPYYGKSMLSCGEKVRD